MIDYTLEGPMWPAQPITWSLATANVAGEPATFSSFIGPGSLFAQAIAAAFDRWAQVANLNFVQVADSPTADIRLGFDHFDGPFNTLGQTSFWFSGNSFLPGITIRFDGDENYSAMGGQEVLANGLNFEIVALHEIGHALGLGHYNNGPAVMNGALSPSMADLAASDIDGIQTLYGPPSPASPAPGIASIYQSVLQRPASVAEQSAWSGYSLSQVRQAVENSAEAQQFVDPIVRLYQAAFGRVPDQAGLDINVDALHGAGGSAMAIAAAFVASQEFANRYGGALVNDAFLGALYMNVLGRQGAASEITAWEQTGKNAVQILIGFSESAEFVQKSATAVLAFLDAAAQGTATYTGSLFGAASAPATTAEVLAVGVAMPQMGGDPVFG